MYVSKIRIGTQKLSSKCPSVFMSSTEVYEDSFEERVVFTQSCTQ